MQTSLDLVTTRAQKSLKEKESNQISLFSMVPDEVMPVASGIGFDCPEQTAPEWPANFLSQYEKEAFGFFFSSHPLLPYRKETLRQNLYTLEDCRDLTPDASVRCAVLVTSVKEIFSKKGDRMAFCQLEDLTTSGECVFFPKIYAECRDLVNSDSPIYLEARISRQQVDAEASDLDESTDNGEIRDIKLIAEKVIPLADACAANTAPVCIDLNASFTKSTCIEELKLLLAKHRGAVPVHIIVHTPDLWCRMELATKYTVQPGLNLEEDLAAWLKVQQPASIL